MRTARLLLLLGNLALIAAFIAGARGHHGGHTWSDGH
jgi:hypothetical protein